MSAGVRVSEPVSGRWAGDAVGAGIATCTGVGALPGVGGALVEERGIVYSSVCLFKLSCPRCEVRFGSTESLGSN